MWNILFYTSILLFHDVFTQQPTMDEIINELIATLTNNGNVTRKGTINKMNEELKNISAFVTNKEENLNKLINEVSNKDTNKANILEGLTNNEFDFLNNNETQNIYEKLKGKMNREDIMKVLDTGGRRNLDSDKYIIATEQQDMLEEIVDRFLVKVPEDKHHINKSLNQNTNWDPDAELEELREFHQEEDGRRLYRGERSTVRHYPFMVSVHVLGRFWCGGVIYWHDLVLTSAACLQLVHNNRFFRENPRVLQVRVGSNHSRVGGELVNALEVYFHPSYNPRTLQNNLALIRLRRHLSFSDKRIPRTILLADYDYPPSPTSEVLLLGWGVKKSSQKMSYEPVFLQSKMLPVYPNVFCKQVYGEKFISQRMFCAGTMTTGEGACDHDAGGPAIIAGKLVGVISFGPAVCGYPNTPTVFTLVGPYIDWIQSVNESMPGYYRGKKRTTTTLSPRPPSSSRSYLEDLLPVDSSREFPTTEPPSNTELLRMNRLAKRNKKRKRNDRKRIEPEPSPRLPSADSASRQHKRARKGRNKLPMFLPLP